MPRYKLTIEYDGGGFVGWQRQENGLSVQQVLEGAIEKFCGEATTLFGAGRTDTGVHALGQVFNCAWPVDFPLDKLQRALNKMLEPEIRIESVEVVPDDFHASFSATGKRYAYDIVRHAHADPFSSRYAWNIGWDVEAGRVEELAQAFVEFVLSREGQMIWAAAPGHVPGPRYRALRRLPIRRDLYEGETLQAMVDGEAMPYVQAEKFTYAPELTGHLFTPLRTIVRVMCIDAHEEMKDAWAALIAADFPPEATARFEDVSAVSYERAGGSIKSTLKGSKVDSVRLMNELGSFFRKNYKAAERLAKEGR